MTKIWKFIVNVELVVEGIQTYNKGDNYKHNYENKSISKEHKMKVCYTKLGNSMHEFKICNNEMRKIEQIME